MLPPPKFHHLHLNTSDANAALSFYTTHFPTCRETHWAGLPAVLSPNDVLLVFTEREVPPLAGSPTAIHHFGWQVTNSRETLAAFLNNPDHKVLPLYTGEGEETVFISSDTWAGVKGVNGLTSCQIDQAKAVGIQPTRVAGFGFLAAPDGVVVEFQGKHPVERFNHVHMYQDDPYCAFLWYQLHLNAPMFQDRGPPKTLSLGNCRVPPGPDRTWPALEKEGMFRSPRAAIEFGDVVLTWYPRQNDQALVSTRGHACDHIGLSVTDLDAWIAKLSCEGVTFLEGEYGVGDTRAIMIEGPSREALELVEAA
jgi:catechol 2,3-dioxygenase-like lactoylglutathione lyase family enzyme